MTVTDGTPNVTFGEPRSRSFDCVLDTPGLRHPGLSGGAVGAVGDTSGVTWVLEVPWLRSERTLLLKRPARFVQDALGELLESRGRRYPDAVGVWTLSGSDTGALWLK